MEKSRLFSAPLIIAFFQLLSFQTQAQDSGRSLLLDGTFEIDLNFDNSMDGYALTPRAEWFVAERWSVGAILVVSGDFSGSGTLLGLLPSTRLYFSAPERRTQWFSELAIGPIFSFFENNTAVAGALVLSGGANFFISRAAAGELTLTFSQGIGFGSGSGSSQLAFTYGFRGFLYRKSDDRPSYRGALGRGSWMVGNSRAQFSIFEGGEFRPTLELTPDLLWFAHPRWAVGGAIPFALAENYVQAGLLPAFRFYGGKLESPWQWFLGLHGGFTHGRDIGSEELDLRYDQWQVSPELGINYFFNPAFALEGRLGYTFSDEDLRQLGTAGAFDFSGNSSSLYFRLGFQVFIRRE